MPSTAEVRKLQDEAVEHLRQLQRDKTSAPPGGREAIDREIDAASAKLRELDAVMYGLLTAGRKL